MVYLKRFLVAVVVSFACVALPISAESDVLEVAAVPVDVVSGGVNINTAAAEVLALKLKGIGVKRAQAIVAYREANGPFSDVDQLQKIKGIGETIITQNQDKIRL